MDKLLGQVAGAAGVKADPGEGIEQTMKEEAVEKMLHDKVEDVAGKKVADSSQAEAMYEKVADAIGDKVPTSMLAAGALDAATDDKKDESGGAAGLLGAATGLLGKK